MQLKHNLFIPVIIHIYYVHKQNNIVLITNISIDNQEGRCMNKSIKKAILMLCVLSIISAAIPTVLAEGNQTNMTVTPIVTDVTTTATTNQTVAQTATKEAKFRAGPTVRLRPLNSEIDENNDGIVELFLNNPSLNDISLEVDMSVSVPSDIYIYGEDGGMSGGAGTVVGHFSVPPGSSRTITLHIKGSKIGDFPVHFGGSYWPKGDKDAWNPISLDNSFKVIEPSETGTEPISKPGEIPYTWIILVAVVLGGIGLIFALGRKPPKTEVNIEQ